MSDHSVLPEDEPRPGGSRRGRRRRSGCLPMLVFVLAGALLLTAAGWYVVRPWAQDLFGDPDDFAGPGADPVCFSVMEGDSVRSVGGRLEDLGVVASTAAFEGAAEAEGANVFPGDYPLQEEMKAADVVAVLADMANAGCAAELTFLPGKRVTELVPLLAENTAHGKRAYRKVLRNPRGLGLPSGARGNPEGYLHPGTYQVPPDAGPRAIVKQMVERWHQEAERLELADRARQMGYSVHELMTVASLVEAEGSTLSSSDKRQIARVIYNRLEDPTAETAGFLQIDATVSYALGRNPGVALTKEELAVDSPYNTRINKGLPPGPIEAPSTASIKAALNPADGDWLYYVTVDLATGETKFADDHDEFLEYKAEYIEYCETSDAC